MARVGERECLVRTPCRLPSQRAGVLAPEAAAVEAVEVEAVGVAVLRCNAHAKRRAQTAVVRRGGADAVLRAVFNHGPEARRTQRREGCVC